MSKEESTIIKGVAILMMLWYHLFDSIDNVNLCSNHLYLFGLPLANVLTRACYPVPFFMILSGYGLSYTYNHKVLDLKGQGKRIFKLYINYWWILLIFVSIGCFVKPEKYPGTVLDITSNIINWNSSYNAETWFLFPYMLMSFSSFFIFKMMDKWGETKVFIISFALSFGAMYLFHAYGMNFIYNYSIISQPLSYLGLLLPFVLGTLMNRYAEKKSLKISILSNHHILCFFVLLCLIVVHCCFDMMIFDSFYDLLFILIFINLPLDNIGGRFLTLMGKHSMPMWMIHTFFCYHLFHDFIYGLKYPIVIYAVLILISYLCSIVIMKIADRSWKIMNNKFFGYA